MRKASVRVTQQPTYHSRLHRRRGSAARLRYRSGQIAPPIARISSSVKRSSQYCRPAAASVPVNISSGEPCRLFE